MRVILLFLALTLAGCSAPVSFQLPFVLVEGEVTIDPPPRPCACGASFRTYVIDWEAHKVRYDAEFYDPGSAVVAVFPLYEFLPKNGYGCDSGIVFRDAGEPLLDGVAASPWNFTVGVASDGALTLEPTLFHHGAPPRTFDVNTTIRGERWTGELAVRGEGVWAFEPTFKAER